jgi:hypothetical protein
MGLDMVAASRTGTTMSVRELWWEWNPRRLRRLLKQAQAQLDANINLNANYFDQMRAAQKRADFADKLTNVYAQQIEGLEFELEARNGELHALRMETQ